ncbi:MAG TPA: ATP-binding cassette domain-containing protein [Actinopolymorphaceae bacterium]
MADMTNDRRGHSSGQEYAIATHGLSKLFRRRAVVCDVDLRVAPGRVYGLLGPNGAGKSTTLKLLLGLLEPDRGAVSLFGRPWQRSALAGVGASIEGPALYGHLSAAENLEVHARLLGLPRSRVGQALGLVGLQGAGRQRVRTFSTGMKGRLALAIALLGDPSVLILDEPHNGLDPEGVVALRQLIRRYTSSGRTVLLSSHVLAEVAQLADDVGVIVDGRLRYQGPLSGLAPDSDLERAYFDLTAPAGLAGSA